MIPFVFAQAQGATPTTSSGINVFGMVFQFAAIIGIFWFLLIRPQQRDRKRLESALMQLKRGDEVVTAGGVVAEVVFVQLQPSADGGNQHSKMDDRITLRSGESKFIVERRGISRVNTKESAA